MPRVTKYKSKGTGRLQRGEELADFFVDQCGVGHSLGDFLAEGVRGSDDGGGGRQL